MRRRVGTIINGKYICVDEIKSGKGIGNAEGSAFRKMKGYWETLGDEEDSDAHIESARQLREVCKKKGFKSTYLENR